MKKLTFIFILILLVGCKSNRPTVEKSRIVKDSTSTVIRIVPRDTIVPVPGDSVRVQVPLKDLGIVPVTGISKSGNLKASVSRVNDQIIVDCDVKELELKLQLLDKEIQILKSKLITEAERIEVPVKFVPWWVKTLAWAGGILIALIVLKLILKSIKPI